MGSNSEPHPNPLLRKERDPDSRLDLTDKVAVVTGATRGIGLATAKALAQAGATLIITGVQSATAVDECASQIHAEFGVDCRGMMVDNADPSAIRGLYAAVFKEFRRLDILVNNAGILQSAAVGMITDEMVRQTLDVNVAGCVHHVQQGARLMARRSTGSIINVASIFGTRGDPGHLVYSASKAAVVGLTLAAAKELGPSGIRVNAVAPGVIQTDMTAGLSESQLQERVGKISLGRPGAPEDVAGAILFLASDLSGYISGHVLAVDGAMAL